MVVANARIIGHNAHDPSPSAENVTWNLFAFVEGSETVNFISVSLFSSMPLNELNKILKYGREQMRKNECNTAATTVCPHSFHPKMSRFDSDC